MFKEEFINFLKQKELESRGVLTHWKKVSNSDEYWKLCRSCVDWMEDSMDLTEDNVVTIRYNESFYDDPKSIDMTYDEFVIKYLKSVNQF